MNTGRIEIRDFTEEKKKTHRDSRTALLFLISGILGILFFLENMAGISFDLLPVGLFSSALCAALWFSFYRSRRAFLLTLLVLTAAVSAAVVLLRGQLYAQLIQTAEAFSVGGEADSPPVTQLALLFSVLLVLLLFGLECIIRSHGILYLLTTALLLLSPLFGVEADAESFVLLILFQAGFFILRAADPACGGNGMSEEKERRIGKKSSAAAALLLVIVFAAACPAAVLFSDELSDGAYRIEGFFVRSFRNFSGSADGAADGGDVSRGNNYRAGNAVLELSVSRRPSEVLYLKGFEGGEYIGGEWLPADEESLFQDIADDLHWRNRENGIAEMFDSMYFSVNQNLVPGIKSGPMRLVIGHSSGDYRRIYSPYCGEWMSGWLYGDSLQGEGYQYEYYERRDMRKDWQSMRSQSGASSNRFRQLQSVYRSHIRNIYTRVPTDILPRLTALTAQNPLSDTDEITAFILHTLDSRASYSLTPGRMPLNGADVAEYFLFEGHSGYCVHFATAATLMYRLYGVPARYVSGYAASPDDFTQQKDGSWRAVLTDEAAHAWTEIFLMGYGWMPVEVTPSAGGDVTASYPGLSTSGLSRLMEEYRQEDDPAQPEEENDGPSQRTEEPEKREESSPRNAQKREVPGRCIVIICCIAAAAAALSVVIRRRKILKNLERSGCRVIFYRFMRMLRYCGEAGDPGETEEDSVQKAAERLSSVTQEEIGRMLEIVGREAYGPYQAEPEERAFVLAVCRRAAEDLYTGLSWHKKISFRLIHVFF